MSLRALTARASRNATIPHKNIVSTSECFDFRHVIRRQSTSVTTEEGTFAPKSISENLDTTDRVAWFFIDSVFPVRFGALDLRHYFVWMRQDNLLGEIQDLLSSVKTHNFQSLSLEPHIKDGGIFVRFSYTTGNSQTPLDDILKDLRSQVKKRGGVPSWNGVPRGEVWLVQGRPWREDLDRYASPLVQVAFEGPDVKEEILYRLFRPFGRIQDIYSPASTPAGQLRSSYIHYKRLRSATIARNTIHGTQISPNHHTSSTLTMLRTSYHQPVHVHVIREYITSHPRIFLPIFVFLIGTLTYTIFDPIRIIMVEWKMNDWLNFKEFTLYKWLQANAFEGFSLTSKHDDALSAHSQNVWQERQEAEVALQRYLSDVPNTVAFVHGPQGSGKSRMLTDAVDRMQRKALVIDVSELLKANSEVKLVSGLAQQTGYWPVFSFANSLNNLIDMASQGLIGQKVGLSSTLREQLKQILEVTASGIARVNTAKRKQRDRARKRAHIEEIRKEDQAQTLVEIKKGRWHDGRLDCVAGNGVMSELGVGIESFAEELTSVTDVHNKLDTEMKEGRRERIEESKRRQQNTEDVESVESIPIVIIRGFESKTGGIGREDLLDVLTEWATHLVENKVAHVVVVSDNRENAKRIARALPSKPLNVITLSDADNASALSLVKQKLKDFDVDVHFTPQQISYIQRLGGRAIDLESLIHKVRSGQTIEDAVEDIVTRGVSELRKSAFGDDIEDAKNLLWSREQAWTIMKQLARQGEISYHEVLLNFPFKGDDNALRSMEHAELITIGTQEGRPTTIKPGKPVYKYVFERLVNDPVFQATQDLALNDKLLASAEATVKNCEQELVTLRTIEKARSSWWSPRSTVEIRADYLLKKMRKAEETIESLEKHKATLKKVVATEERS